MLKHTAGPSHACTRHLLNGSTQFQASSAAQVTTPEAQLHKPATTKVPSGEQCLWTIPNRSPPICLNKFQDLATNNPSDLQRELLFLTGFGPCHRASSEDFVSYLVSLPVWVAYLRSQWSGIKPCLGHISPMWLECRNLSSLLSHASDVKL